MHTDVLVIGGGNAALCAALMAAEAGAKVVAVNPVRTGYGAIADEWIGIRPVVDHVVINWEAVGHPPPKVYDVPHFDFHFYLVKRAETMKVRFNSDAESADPRQQPPAELLPAGAARQRHCAPRHKISGSPAVSRCPASVR